MGNFISNILESINWGKLEKKILLVGLDGAGKTTILYKLHLGDTIHTIPTVGFNVETVTYRNIEFTAWDVVSKYFYPPSSQLFINSFLLLF